MPQLHHVNLGVNPGGLDAEASFLIDVLALRRVDAGPDMTARGVNWFDDDAGFQVHLSPDPDHRPAERAHVAVSIDDLDKQEDRLKTAGVEFTTGNNGDLRILFCRDPSGNRWELRGRPSAA
jgi:catechol 2,3-dioxygenase-like lactoylglutathione lyase family enzyme